MSLLLEYVKSGLGTVVRPPSAAIRMRHEKSADASPVTEEKEAPPRESVPALLSRGSILARPVGRSEASNLPPSLEHSLKRALRNSGIHFKQCSFKVDKVGEKDLHILALLSESVLPAGPSGRGGSLDTLLFDIRRGRGTVSVLVYPADSPSPWREGRGFCGHNSSYGYARAITQALDGLLSFLAPQGARG